MTPVYVCQVSWLPCYQINHFQWVWIFRYNQITDYFIYRPLDTCRYVQWRRHGGNGWVRTPPPHFCSDPSWDLHKSVEKCFLYGGVPWMYIVTFYCSPAKKNCSDPPLFLGWRRHWLCRFPSHWISTMSLLYISPVRRLLLVLLLLFVNLCQILAMRIRTHSLLLYELLCVFRTDS